MSVVRCERVRVLDITPDLQMRVSGPWMLEVVGATYRVKIG